MKNKSTKSLKQIYNESLLCEMPERMPGPYDSYDYLEDNDKNHIMAGYYIEDKRGNLIEQFKDSQDINIYQDNAMLDNGASAIAYVLINIDKKEVEGIIYLVKIEDTNNVGYFSTCGLWKKKSATSGLIFNFFTKWLLPKYKTIISDNKTSELGERFWLKIAKYGLANNKKCGIFREKEAIKSNIEQFKRLYKIDNFSLAWEDKDRILQRIYISE